MVYKQVNIGALTQKQLKAAASGKPISITASQIAGSGTSFYVHPENHKKIAQAKRKGTGTRLYICDGAIQHDIMKGGSLWSWLKGAAKDAYKFTKDNWSDIKPYVSRAADVAIPGVATYFGQPTAGVAARSLLKSMTGVGTGSKLIKGSPEAKARMAAIRARKKGSGIILN
jgi:hypothetical protein